MCWTWYHVQQMYKCRWSLAVKKPKYYPLAVKATTPLRSSVSGGLTVLRACRLQCWPELRHPLFWREGRGKLGQTKLKPDFKLADQRLSEILFTVWWNVNFLHVLDRQVSSFIHDHIPLIRPAYTGNANHCYYIICQYERKSRELLVYIGYWPKLDCGPSNWFIIISFLSHAEFLYFSSRHRVWLSDQFKQLHDVADGLRCLRLNHITPFCHKKLTANLKSGFHLSVESNSHLLWFFIAMLRDWLKTHVTLSSIQK